jgi:transposase
MCWSPARPRRIARPATQPTSATDSQSESALIEPFGLLEIGIRKAEEGIFACHRANESSWRLVTIPGAGPITASATVASTQDARLFGSGRRFAAWLGLTAWPRSSGVKERAYRPHRPAGQRLRPAQAAKLLKPKLARLMMVALANKTDSHGLLLAGTSAGISKGAPSRA